MTRKIEIGGVCERDLDLFLQEQFSTSDRFCTWFGENAGLQNVLGAATPAKRSQTDRTGESDIEVELNVGESLPALLLIENKITAQFQPMQAERYKDRGKGRLRSGKASTFKTVLVAPKEYFSGDLKNFDARISLEQIRQFLRTNRIDESAEGLSHSDYKIALLDAAIKRLGSAQKSKEKPFTANYWSLIEEIAPEFMRKKIPPEIGDTMLFVDSRPTPCVLPSHRLAQGKFGSELETSKEYGNFDILIENSVGQIDEIRDAFKGVLLPHIEIVPAGKSTAFRIAVPRILKSEQVEGKAQVAAARTAIYLGRDLYQWFINQRHIWKRFIPPE